MRANPMEEGLEGDSGVSSSLWSGHEGGVGGVVYVWSVGGRTMGVSMLWSLCGMWMLKKPGLMMVWELWKCLCRSLCGIKVDGEHWDYRLK